MARDHARILVSIWSDPDFTALDPAEQHAYLMLLSSPDLSYCGVLDLVPERYAGRAAGLTTRRFRAALDGLAKRRFVVVDDRTGEVLVRSYVRHDGVLKVPNVAKAMTKALMRTHSAKLRQVVVDELARAMRENPDARGWQGVAAVNPELFDQITEKAFENPSLNPSANPSGNPSGNPSAKGSGNPSGKGWWNVA